MLLREKMKGIPGIVQRRLRPDGLQRCTSVVILRYTGEGWDGPHRNTVLKALQAEGLPCGYGYGWPNYKNPAFIRMQETTGHRAFAFGVDKFPDWSAYAERCPASERACDHEAIFLMHEVFLGDRADMQMIADAFGKVYEYRHELAR